MKDLIIAELRKMRDAHAAKFNYDFDAIAQDWLKEEAAARRAGQKCVDLSAKVKSRRHPSVTVKTNKARCKSGYRPVPAEVLPMRRRIVRPFEARRWTPMASHIDEPALVPVNGE